ncbi:MAG TPA: PKD domain-containing protein [Steroidobacteraceae bacterium]|nr:PKD domain-containing protein [Steroidobacteraceae bacterium]
MSMNMCARGSAGRLAAALLLQFVVVAAYASPALHISPLGYRVTQVQAVRGDPRAYDVTARAGIANLGDKAFEVTARLTSRFPRFIVLDGDVSFGDVPRTGLGRPVISGDTFKLRVMLPAGGDLRTLLQFVASINESLEWVLSCANCGNTNRAPLANAGADQTVYASQVVSLDGSASSDPDGQPLTYRWSFVTRPAGSAASLDDPANVKPTFVPDRDGDYIVQLIVSDGVVDSAPDTVQISTLNSAPVANAGADQTAFVGQPVMLDGSASSDIDGDALTYAWSLTSAPAGSQAAIVDPAQVRATFTPDLPGTFSIELIVDDGSVASAPDTMKISTETRNSPPVANAGPDQTVHVGDTAQLDGTGSTDADGNPLTFNWSLSSRPAQSAATLQGQDTATASLTIDRPGTYVAQLIVNDGNTDSSPDTIALSTVNTLPTAVVVAPASVNWRARVQLDGTASSDPDADALGFSWSILSRPDGSAAALTDANAMTPVFDADRPGLYVVQLVVSDGTGNSVPASASITATNSAPLAADDQVTTGQDSAVDIDVLANDSDADGDALSIQSLTQPAHGAASSSGTAVHYVPAAGFVGTDAFTYIATDGADVASASVLVEVTGNTKPTARLDITPATTNVGSAVTLSFAGSSDPDANDHIANYSLVLRSAPAASQGGGAGSTVFAIDVPQTTTRTSLPFVPDAPGAFSFELVVIDSHGATSAAVSAELTATAVTPANNAPTAVLAISPGTVQLGPVNAAATLDFTQSSDPDAGDHIASYMVTLIAAPAASQGGTSAGPQFVVGTTVETTLDTLRFGPDAAGVYRFELRAVDSFGAQSAAVTADLVALAALPPDLTITKIEIAPSAVLLTPADPSRFLVARVLNSRGEPLAVSMDRLEFIGATDEISLSPQGAVSANVFPGSAFVRVRLREDPSIVSDPVLVTAAELTENEIVVVLGDEEILTDPATEGAPAGAYRVDLSRSIDPGTLVLGSGSRVVAGRVVASEGEPDGSAFHTDIELVPLPTLFRSLRVNFAFTPDELRQFMQPVSAQQAAPQLAQSARVAARYANLQPLAIAATDADRPPCKAETALNELVLEAQGSVNPSVGFDFALEIVDSTVTQFRLIASGSLAPSAKITGKVVAAISTTLSCKLDLFKIIVPVSGPLAAFIRPEIPIGLKGSLSVEAQVNLAEITAEMAANAFFSSGVSYQLGSGFADVDSLTLFAETPQTSLTLGSDPTIQFRAKAAGAVTSGINVGSLAFSFKAIDLSAGPELDAKFVPVTSAMTNEALESGYKLNLVGKAGPGADLQQLLELIFGSLQPIDPTFTTESELARSPTAVSLTVDRAQFKAGDQLAFEVRLDPAHVAFPGYPYNVDQVRIYQRGQGAAAASLIATAPAPAGQTTLPVSWIADKDGQTTDAVTGRDNFFAFVVPTFLSTPASLLPFKLGPVHARAPIEIVPKQVVLAPGGTKQFTARVDGEESTNVTWAATGGTISSSGLFRAGNTPGPFKVTVTRADDPDIKDEATVDIRPICGADASIAYCSFAYASVPWPAGQVWRSAAVNDNGQWLGLLTNSSQVQDGNRNSVYIGQGNNVRLLGEFEVPAGGNPTSGMFISSGRETGITRIGEYKLSNSNAFAGVYSTPAVGSGAFVSQNGATTLLAGLNGPADGSWAADVSDDLVVVGMSSYDVAALSPYRAVRWVNGMVEDLGLGDRSRAIAINSAHQILVWTSIGTVIWQDGVVTGLPDSAGCAGYDINSAGDVVAICESGSAVWRNGSRENLGEDIRGYLINDKGDVLGEEITSAGAAIPVLIERDGTRLHLPNLGPPIDYAGPAGSPMSLSRTKGLVGGTGVNCPDVQCGGGTAYVWIAYPRELVLPPPQGQQ